MWLNDIVTTSRFFKEDTTTGNITNYCTVYTYLLAAHSTEPVVERLLFILIHFLEFMNLL